MNRNPSIQQWETQAVISGGGPVGLMLALGLAQQGRQMALVEALSEKQTEASSFDGRVLALTLGSQEILQQLGIWESLAPFVEPIEHVHVSQKGYLGITQIDASELRLPALGYSVTASDLGRILWQAVFEQAKIQVFRPAKVKDFVEQADVVQVEIETASGKKRLSTQLLVGADGTQSQVRKLLGLPIQEKSYRAFGIIAKIETEQPPQGWSYERFTTEGPVALLPMGGHASKAVLVCPEDQVNAYLEMEDEAFIQAFAEKMGERLGRFTAISPRAAYPLKETYVPQMTKGRAVLMGNASHTQHPVAAQGLNLGIRDVAAFLQLVQSQQDIGRAELLEHYARQRREDHEKIMGLTDGLIQVFQAPSPLLGHLRGLGLMAVQALPPLKKRFARFAMRGVSIREAGH